MPAPENETEPNPTKTEDGPNAKPFFNMNPICNTNISFPNVVLGNNTNSFNQNY